MPAPPPRRLRCRRDVRGGLSFVTQAKSSSSTAGMLTSPERWEEAPFHQGPGARTLAPMMFTLRPKTAGRLAWSAWAVAMILIAVSVVLMWTAPGSLTGLLNGNNFDPHLLLIPGFMTVGAAIVSRRPSNRIGWLFLGLGLVSAVETTSYLYGLHAFSVRPPRFGGAFAVWLSNWEWSAAFGLLFFLLLLFPDGRRPSHRWRPVAWAMGFFAGVFVLYGMFQDEPLQIN